MDSLTRLGPYVWPYRRLMAWSVIFALLVAGLWGANLSVAFPVVKVLLENQGLHEYIDTEIARCERQITKDSKRLDDLERAIQNGGQPDNDLDDNEIGLPILEKKTRLQARVTDSSHQLLGYRKIKT